MKRLAFALLVLFALLAAPLAAVAQTERGYEWWWGHPTLGMGLAWAIGLVLFLLLVPCLVVAGLVLGIWWLVRRGRESRLDSALTILRERYARGEVSKEEFEAKKRDLT
jgi:putative membrane protein